MKENTAWILTYMLLVAAFAYMIGWVSGELLCRCKNAEEKVAELHDQLAHTCSGTQRQQRQFKELRSVLNETLDIYAKAVTPSKRRAHERIVDGLLAASDRNVGLVIRRKLKVWVPRFRENPVSRLECGGQRRDRTADAGLFRAALYH